VLTGVSREIEVIGWTTLDHFDFLFPFLFLFLPFRVKSRSPLTSRIVLKYAILDVARVSTGRRRRWGSHALDETSGVESQTRG
jgi:hypothetical protein